MSKKAKSSKKKAKRQRISVRDQIKASKSSKSLGGGGGGGDIKSDPIGGLDSEWYKTAREADKWKPKWECMQTLMEYACGDVHGNQPLPPKFDDNKNAIDVITIFAKWLNDENHIFTRQHILKLLIPFGNTYSKSQWKKANKLAEGLIIKQWQEKKHGFLPLVTPALISVYIASGAQLKKWKEYLIQSMDSPQGQVRMSCWDFLAKICILSKQDSKLKTRGPKDVELFINDSKIIQYLKNTILNDKEKDVRESCAKFIYGAKQICNKVSILESAYKEILNDKRASMALDIAADLFNNDKTLLSGGKISDDVISKKVEKKQLKQKKKQASSRKNNMKAMIARAKKEAEKKGGGGVIEIASVGGAKINNEEDEDQKKNKKKKDKDKDKGKGKKRGGMQALMKKYKEQAKSKPNVQASDDEEEDEDEDEDEDDNDKEEAQQSDHDDDNKSEDSDSSASSSEDSEMERRKEREKKKKDRERQRREAAKKREEKRKQIEREKEKERLRKKKEKEEDRKRKEREKRDKERKEKKEKKEKKQKYKTREKRKKKRRYGSDSDSDSDSDSNSERDSISDSNTNSEDNGNDNDSDSNPKRRNNKTKSSRHTSSRNGRNLNESRTETIDDLSSTAKTSKTSKTELLALSKKVDAISSNVELLQNGMNGMERKMSDIAKNSESKSGMSTKTEEKIMKILAQLQKDVKIMKNDISYIKACWEDAESIPSDE